MKNYFLFKLIVFSTELFRNIFVDSEKGNSTYPHLKHGLIFCMLEGWLSLIRRSITGDNNYSQCCNYPACIIININNPFISNDHQIIWRNYNIISD